MAYRFEKIKPYNPNESKGEQVGAMFDNIAPAYDKLNHTMSMGIDRCWRRKAINLLRPFHPQTVLDVATGTGDFAILACKRLQPKQLIGVDISEGMMAIAKEKAQALGLDAIRFEQEDCMKLSYDDCTFDAVTVAFGVRNFESLDKGLSELHRVLTANGHLVILELSVPCRTPIKQLFGFYSHTVMPILGRLLSKDKKAYTYLPASIEAFPQGEEMRDIMYKAGFSSVTFKRLTLGVCTLYVAQK